MKTVAAFLSHNEVNHRKKGYTKTEDPREYLENIDKPIVRLSVPKALFSECAVKGCSKRDIEVHHVRALRRVRHGYTIESIKSGRKTLKGRAMIESALSRKQIPLCKKHHVQWHKLNPIQLDENYLKKTLK